LLEFSYFIILKYQEDREATTYIHEVYKSPTLGTEQKLQKN